MPQPQPVSPPVALTIAGSDCSAGAGLQADLKTFAAHGVYGLTAVTCVVAEVPGKVSRLQPVDPDILNEQLHLLLEAFPIAAVKTGMLYSAALIRQVAARLCSLPPSRRPRLVVDPVMVATSGDSLIQDDAVAAYREALFPLADLLTPNMDEATTLLGRKVTLAEDLPAAAAELAAYYGAAVLLKGGHLRGDTAVDALAFPPGHPDATPQLFTAPFVPDVSTHGTGCTYSAAITSHLAHGRPLPEAIAAAKDYVTHAIRHLCRWGDVDALNHSALR